MTRFGNISPLWLNFKCLRHFLKVFYCLAKLSTHFGKVCLLLGQIYLCCKWPKIESTLSIWSHCWCSKGTCRPWFQNNFRRLYASSFLGKILCKVLAQKVLDIKGIKSYLARPTNHRTLSG